MPRHHRPHNPEHADAVLRVVGANHIEHTIPGWTDALRERLSRDARRTEPTDLPAFLAAKPAASAPSDAEPVLVILTDAEARADIARVVDSLAISAAPAIVLLEHETPEITPMLEHEGIIGAPWDTPIDTLALMIDTLARRQSAVTRLGSDLRLSELAMRGAQGEVAQIHDELRGAAGIQRRCLPTQTPEIDGLDMGVIFRPACHVSGDIFDIVELDEHRTGLFLADAVGHGVPAALMTMIISQGLRTTDGVGADARVVEPHDALARLNTTLLEHPSDKSRFATAVYAIHDRRDGTLTIAGAGHPPAMLVRTATAETEYIESGGPLLGVFDDAEFGSTTITLQPGDLVVLYSDGFELAFPDPGANDVTLPTEHYLEALARTASADGLRDAARDLEHTLDQQRGSLNQQDDITALFLCPRETLAGSVHKGASRIASDAA